jgi:GntR family transcriptional regulator
MQNQHPSSRVTLNRPKHKTLTDATVTAIQEAIHQGKFPAGSQLPPELNLMEMLGVSRTTLREALRTLEEQGAIYRRRGLGTFVSERAIVKDLSINFGIMEMITQAGYTPKTVNCEIRTWEASGKLAQDLEIPEGTAVVSVQRLRLANDTPIIISEDFVPVSILKGKTIKESDVINQSLYDYLEKTCNIRILQGVATMRPVGASREVAEKLQIHRNDILMLISQIDYDENHRPVIFSTEYHLPDKITFVIHRKGPHR